MHLHELFLRTLWLLRDYLQDLVIAGGWAPYIYARYWLQQPGPEPIRTYDLDFAVPLAVPVRQGDTIDHRLAQFGFVTRLAGDEQPPLCRYVLQQDRQEFLVDFLTRVQGRKHPGAVQVQAGLSATALRYVELLLEHKQAVNIRDVFLDGTPVQLTAWVVTPGAYLLQKGLTFPRRGQPAKQAKDLHYIVSLLRDYPDLQPAILAELQALRGRHPAWFRTFRHNLARAFSHVDAPAVVQVRQLLHEAGSNASRPAIYATIQALLQACEPQADTRELS